MHPHQKHRGHHVERQRVHDIAGHHAPPRVNKIAKGHYAAGGGVHGDEAEDKKLIRKTVKKEALRADGGSVKARGDRPCRARGGKVSKAKGNTVNIVISPSGKDKPSMPMPGVMPPPMAPPGGPAPVGPAAMPPPGLAGAAPPMRPPLPAAGPVPTGPMPMPPRSAGGRAYKRGGGVKKSEADMKGKTGIGDRTPIQHSGNKSDTQNVGRGPVITRATGGPVEADGRNGKQMAPDWNAGAGGARARLKEAHGQQGYLSMNKAQARAAQHPGGKAS